MTTPVKRMSLKDQGAVALPTATISVKPRQQLTFQSWLRLLTPHESIDDLQNPVFWRDVFMEVVVCMFVECCVVWALVTLHPTSYKPNTTHFGIFAGFFIYSLIEGYGPISGAPLNPAGCWGFFLAGRMSAARMFFYSLGETGGAAAGAMIGFSLQPHNNVTILHSIKPGEGMIPGNAMMVEAILTFNLLFVALSVTNPFAKIAIMPSFPIAFCIGTGIMAAGTHTGGLQNPIVPFGPAVVTGDFENHWIYWVGPYLGATVGSIVYQICQFIKDHYEHHIVHNDDNVGLDNPAHSDHRDDEPHHAASDL